MSVEMDPVPEICFNSIITSYTCTCLVVYNVTRCDALVFIRWPTNQSTVVLDSLAFPIMSAASKKRKGNEAKKPFVPAKKARPHQDTVDKAKSVWNKLRQKSNTKEQQKKLMDELYPLIKGKSYQIALKHDASRIIQAALQFGSSKQRQEVAMELVQGDLLELCNNAYAHHSVVKVIKYCHKDDKVMDRFKSGLRNKVAKLAVHSVGSRVLDAIFLNLSSQKSYTLKEELYGPHFSVFVDEEQKSKTLADKLKAQPTKKDATLQFVQRLIDKGIEKRLYGLVYLQDLWAEYIEFQSPNELRTMAAAVADDVIHLLSTRAGTYIACKLVTYGTAKERKRFMKSIKGRVRQALLHRDSYLFVLRLIHVTDDTKAIQKMVLNEIGEDILELLLSTTASKLFLMILVQDVKEWEKCFDPYEHKALVRDATIEVGGEETPVTKKKLDVRQQELLPSIQKQLVKVCQEHISELLQSKPGSLVLQKCYATCATADMAAALLTAVLSEDGSDLFEGYTSHFAIKKMIVTSTSLDDDKSFGKALSRALDKDAVSKLCESNRGAFIVATLVENDFLSVKQVDIETIQKKAKAKKVPVKGYEALLGLTDKK